MLFDSPTWEEDCQEDIPRLSALTWGVSKSVEMAKKMENNANNSEKKTPKKKKDKKLKSEKISTKISNLTSKASGNMVVSAIQTLDKVVNTPSSSKPLLSDETPEAQESNTIKSRILSGVSKVCQTGKELQSKGHLLTLGIKFSSSDAFSRYIGLPKKIKQGKKRRREEEAQQNSEIEKATSQEEKEGNQNNKELKMKKIPEAEVDKPVAPPRKKKKVDVYKLREVLSHENPDTTSEVSSEKKVKKSLAEEAKMKLSASRFRYLNEQLYTQPGNASAKMFKSDDTLFSAYHEGYQHQASQWPLDPLNVIIADCMRLDGKAVIADFGCGEARLARSVENEVSSFDLVAANERVVACDMANVPLPDTSVDVAVFCLSLMGTNIRDYLFEASRVLKVGGTLKIAELESRFKGEACDINKFIESIEKFGFQNSWKDLQKDFFYFLDFKKVTDCKKKKGKLPDIELKPCLYKKR